MSPRAGVAGASLIAGTLSLRVIAVLAGLEGCANVIAPRGGPPDSSPPILVVVEPESLAVRPGFKGDVRFEFNESISERNIRGAVILYPFEPRPRVKKGKRDLRVRPRQGWVEGRIYHVRVEPVIQDLFNNSLRRPIRYVFSTGAPVPPNRVEGTAYDRITGRPLVNARLDMVHLPDTLRYGTTADSVGAFRLGSLPSGSYFAIGYEDRNQNQRADAFDRSDTIRVELGSSDKLTLEFHVFHHDTLGPQLTRVQSLDSLAVELEFDGYLDPDSALSTGNVQVFALPDSVPIALDTVLHNWEYALWREARRQAARAEADTLGLEAPAQADTSAVRPPPADTAGAAGVAERGPQAEGPQALPSRRIILIADQPIPPGSYGVRVRGILNLSGLEGGGEGTWEQPARPDDSEPEDGPAKPPG